MANINQAIKTIKQSIQKQIPMQFLYTSKKSPKKKGMEPEPGHLRTIQACVLGKRVTKTGYKLYVRGWLLAHYSYSEDSVFANTGDSYTVDYWRLYQVPLMKNCKLKPEIPYRWNVNAKNSYNDHDLWFSTILAAIPKPTGKKPKEQEKQPEKEQPNTKPNKEKPNQPAPLPRPGVKSWAPTSESLVPSFYTEWINIIKPILKENNVNAEVQIYASSQYEEIGCVEEGLILINSVWLEQRSTKGIMKGLERLIAVMKEGRKEIPIPEAIRKNYQITNSLADIRNWKAKIYLNNSVPSDSKLGKGDMDEVRYIAVGLNTGVIFPIAIQDEHQSGYELIGHLKRKSMIPNDTYITVAGFGTTYVSESDSKEMIKALKLLLSYGLNPDLTIKDWDRRGECSVEEYVNDKGFKPTQEGQLTKRGRRIIDELEKVSLSYKQFIYHENIATEERFKMEAKEFIGFIVDYARILDLANIPNYWDRIKVIMDSEDTKELADFIFSHNGIKNVIHTNVKNEIKAKSYNYADIKNLVGDPLVFLDELNRLSNV